MADRVRFVMERMASTLAKMLNMGVFTKEEIKSIVKKRTDFEYVLMRRQLYEKDFDAYLQFELKLNKLRYLSAYILLCLYVCMSV